jgi:alpha-L-rhamnosidase
VPNVWIDHFAYKQQRHKQCAFNLYVAAMLEHAFAPLAHAHGQPEWERFSITFARAIVSATQRNFWRARDRMYINNLPWAGEEGEERMCDPSLATAVLFGSCPQDDTSASLRALGECPENMGLSYPANAGWRYWALGKAGFTDVILDEFRNRWAAMESVQLNNTLAEIWNAHPDSGDLWSHCAIVPLYTTFMSIAGIRPTAPGFARCTIAPRPGTLTHLELTARTVRGDIAFRSLGSIGDRELHLRVPSTMTATLQVDNRESLDLARASGMADSPHAFYLLPADKEIVLHLKHL